MRQLEFKPVAAGIFLALAALLIGELHGLSFGAKEDAIKDHFKSTAQANAGSLGSEAAVSKAQADAWKYLKRAHEHYMGLGAAAIGLCLLAGFSTAKPVTKTAASTAVGFGALVYPFFWTMTSLKTASVGGHAAKESLEIIAQAGAGIGFLGLLGVIAITTGWAFSRD